MTNNYYNIFDDHGRSPATPEEWLKASTTHDYVWLFNVTNEFTQRVMRDYFENHQDPNIVSSSMDLFIEEIQRQTGLSVEETASLSTLGKHILDDREFRDDPAAARASAWDLFQMMEEVEETNIEDEVPEDIKKMAEEFSEMMQNRNKKRFEDQIALKEMELSMMGEGVDDILKKLVDEIREISGLNEDNNNNN